MSLNETINNLGTSIINLVDKKRQGTLGLEQGDVGYDKEVLEDIRKYKHSTFDLSKFEVVGSPNISDDGIASGFSKTIYFSPIVNLVNPSNIKISISGVLLELSGTKGRTYFSLSSGDYSLKLYLNNFNRLSGEVGRTYPDVIYLGGDAYHLTLNAKFKTILNIDVKNNTVQQIVYMNDKLLFEGPVSSPKAFNFDTDFVFSSAKMTLGAGGSTGYTGFTGSIDLKEFSVTVDGVEVFNGNKTGLDVIKPNNYTVVGSPTISDDGVASGFSSTDYVKTNNPNVSDYQNYEIDIPFNPSQINCMIAFKDYIIGLVSGDTWGNTYGKIALFLGDGSDWNISAGGVKTGITQLVAGTNYVAKIIRTPSQYILKLLNLDTGIETTEVTVDSTANLGNTSNIELGSDGRWEGRHQKCIHDLNSFKIYVDGKLVYQPCLKIPCTESKTGSKIVPAYARGRVIDLYEQEGYAGYYTIQEDKKGNYALIGSPTISTDWVASGFSRGTNFIQIPFTFNTTSTYKIQLTVETPNNPVVNGYLLGGSGQFFEIYCQGTDLDFYYRDNENNVKYIGKYIPQPNTKYHIYCEFNLSTLNIAFGVKKEGETDYKIYSAVMSSYITPTTSTRLGDTNNEHSIYLNDFKIYADSKLAYQAVTPPNYTLPMGDVYGVLSAKSNSSEIARYSMPSDKYIDLTLGASGSTYTAPANGWFILSYTATNDNCYVSVVAGGLISEHFTSVATNYGSNSVPCRKGQTCLVNYRNMAKRNFRFVYAEGEV